MSSPSSQANPFGHAPALFATTHWSVVLAAGNSTSPHAAEALEQLCRTYWYPLYAYVRRSGQGPQDAEDLTQGFFARLLEKKGFQRAQRERQQAFKTAVARGVCGQWRAALTASSLGRHRGCLEFQTLLKQKPVTVADNLHHPQPSHPLSTFIKCRNSSAISFGSATVWAISARNCSR